jgi:hypothetical protein
LLATVSADLQIARCRCTSSTGSGDEAAILTAHTAAATDKRPD